MSEQTGTLASRPHVSGQRCGLHGYTPCHGTHALASSHGSQSSVTFRRSSASAQKLKNQDQRQNEDKTGRLSDLTTSSCEEAARQTKT
ncbi:hypothetical protein STEG23_023391 [Scotinomys teguina]